MEQPLPTPGDYLDVIVHKPWGFEYLVYRNTWVALWYLRIHGGNRTSLHCHPRKKTGLILLSGEATVSYLNDSVRLKTLDKLIIRPGLFHSTAAFSTDGVALLEIETPPEKENLVRLDDAYGRKEMPYEGSEAIFPITGNCVRLEMPERGQSNKYSLHGCLLSVEFIQNSAEARCRETEEVIVVLEGGLFSKSHDPVLAAGDVVSTGTLARLADSFTCRDGMYLLAIRKEI